MLWACGSDDDSAGGSSDKGPRTLSLKTYEDIPTCDASNENQLVYIKDQETFYECSLGEWVSVNIKGHDGIDGVNGIDGSNGIDGANGIDGTNGANGVDGVDGINGTNGVDGQDGTDGVSGIYIVKTLGKDYEFGTRVRLNGLEDLDYIYIFVYSITLTFYSDKTSHMNVYGVIRTKENDGSWTEKPFSNIHTSVPMGWDYSYFEYELYQPTGSYVTYYYQYNSNQFYYAYKINLGYTVLTLDTIYEE
jgi:hypothetical protein